MRNLAARAQACRTGKKEIIIVNSQEQYNGISFCYLTECFDKFTYEKNTGLIKLDIANFIDAVQKPLKDTVQKEINQQKPEDILERALQESDNPASNQTAALKGEIAKLQKTIDAQKGSIKDLSAQSSRLNGTHPNPKASITPNFPTFSQSC